MRRLQLEYGAEIGRAIVNFDGPIVFCVISRFHGGAFVVFSRAAQRQPRDDRARGRARVGDRRRAGRRGRVRPRRRHAHARGRADRRARRADRRRRGRRARAAAGRARGALGRRCAPRSSASWRASSTRSTASQRAVEVGSVDRIIPAAELRPHLIDAVERGMQQTLDGLAAGNGGRFRRRRQLRHLGEPERVARRVVEARVDAVGALLGLLGELDAARLELLVVRAHVVGGEEERAGEALGREVEDLLARLVVEHRLAGDGHQHDGEVGLARGADGEPAEVAHLGHGDVGADLPAQLLGVEGERLVLVVNPHL